MESLAPGAQGQTPEAYSDAVEAFSTRSPGQYLVPGNHYAELARLLRAPSPVPTLPSPFCFVAVLDLQTTTNSSHEVHSADSVASFRELLNPAEYLQGPQISTNTSQLIFLRGHPSGAWLRTLGAALRVDPEFWRCHQVPAYNREFFDLPTLPSFTQRSVRLRVSTIFNCRTAGTRKEVESARLDARELIRTHHSALEKKGYVGDSIVRQLHAHSESSYSIEQDISCTLVKKSGGWAALVWLDIGKPIAETPWPRNSNPLRNAADYCLPIIQPTPKAALSRDPLGDNDGGSSAPPSISSVGSCTQSSSFLASRQYGASLRKSLMRTSPLYALSDIFRHSACSSSQVINLMHRRMSDALRAAHHLESMSLADLRFCKDILDDHTSYLQEVITFLEGDAWSPGQLSCPPSQSCIPRHQAGGSVTPNTSSMSLGQGQLQQQLDQEPLGGSSGQMPKRPAPAGGGDARRGNGTAESTQEELLEDFRSLLRRTKELSGRCQDGTEVILSGAQLRESQKAIEQAMEVKLLTKLVFVFAPLSWLTSVFGMNFVDLPWNQGLIAVCVAAVVLVGCLAMASSPTARVGIRSLASSLYWLLNTAWIFITAHGR